MARMCARRFLLPWAVSLAAVCSFGSAAAAPKKKAPPPPPSAAPGTVAPSGPVAKTGISSVLNFLDWGAVFATGPLRSAGGRHRRGDDMSVHLARCHRGCGGMTDVAVRLLVVSEKSKGTLGHVVDGVQSGVTFPAEYTPSSEDRCSFWGVVCMPSRMPLAHSWHSLTHILSVAWFVRSLGAKISFLARRIIGIVFT
jgi:hypothetical protein